MKNNQEHKMLNIDLQLPDNSIELKSLNRTINETIVPRISNIKYLDNDTYKSIVDNILDILYQVGELSIPLFDVAKQIEDEYFKVYIHAPELAKTLWQKEYHEHHKPYNVIKNKCFHYLDLMENKYIQQHGKKPMVHDKITTEYNY